MIPLHFPPSPPARRRPRRRQHCYTDYATGATTTTGISVRSPSAGWRSPSRPGGGWARVLPLPWVFPRARARARARAGRPARRDMRSTTERASQPASYRADIKPIGSYTLPLDSLVSQPVRSDPSGLVVRPLVVVFCEFFSTRGGARAQRFLRVHVANLLQCEDGETLVHAGMLLDRDAAPKEKKSLEQSSDWRTG